VLRFVMVAVVPASMFSVPLMVTLLNVDEPVLAHLEDLDLSFFTEDSRFRLPIQYVIRPLTKELHDYRGYAGTISSGSVTVGQGIAVMPAGKTTTVTGIETPSGQVNVAGEGEAVTIRIADDFDISRGAMFCSTSDVVRADSNIKATVCWMSERVSLRQGAIYRIKHTTHTARAIVNELECKIDINRVANAEECDHLELNEIGQVVLRTSEPLIFDEYSVNRTTGSFILIDEGTNETVGAGLIGAPSFVSAPQTEPF
ncbi:MAG: elongation factor 1-alpha C-terminal domain-related protein, partial [Dehalococcoidia bacterium]